MGKREEIIKALGALDGGDKIVNMVNEEFNRLEVFEKKTGELETENSTLKTTLGDVENELAEAKEKAGKADDLGDKKDRLETLLEEQGKEIKFLKDKSIADDEEKTRLNTEKAQRKAVDSVSEKVSAYFGENLKDVIDLALTRRQLVVEGDGTYTFGGKAGDEAIEKMKADYSYKIASSRGTGTDGGGGGGDDGIKAPTLNERLRKGFGEQG